MMKIGFSSAVCPGWDLRTMIAKAKEFGFDGVELRGLRGELNLPLVSELAGRPAAVKSLLADGGIELVCLASSVTLDSRKAGEVAEQKRKLGEYIELASSLGCPYVRLFAGEVQSLDHHRAALSRIAEGLISMADAAAGQGVTLLVENGGDFCGSDDLWFLVDAADHPGVRGCWNQCHAMTLGERPTNSLPRLGTKIGMVHLCDADFDEQNRLLGYQSLGEGGCEVDRQIELLRGLAYDRYLMFEWPKLWVPAIKEPDAALPEVQAYLRARLDEKQKVLSAYKGDKHAPRMASRA